LKKLKLMNEKSTLLTKPLPSKLLTALVDAAPKDATYTPKSRMSTVLSLLLSPWSSDALATYRTPLTETPAAVEIEWITSLTCAQP